MQRNRNVMMHICNANMSVYEPIPFHLVTSVISNRLSLDQSTLLYVGHIRGIAAEVDVLAADRGDQPRRGPHASKL